ncbi:30S ribosomal protein S17 [bacterium]|nr:30S ribosomal protein S17 [bacterium]
MTEERNRRRKLTGEVAKLSGNQTVSVEVASVGVHGKYGKVVRSSKKYLVHDEASVSKVGDVVEISEIRPISKRKTWRLVSVVKKA